MSDESFKYALKWTAADAEALRERQGNVEDATAILSAVKRQRDSERVYTLMDCPDCGAVGVRPSKHVCGQADA